MFDETALLKMTPNAVISAAISVMYIFLKKEFREILLSFFTVLPTII